MEAREPENWNLKEVDMVSQTQDMARRMQVPIKAWDLVFCSGPSPHVWPRGPQYVCQLWWRPYWQHRLDAAGSIAPKQYSMEVLELGRMRSVI